MKPMKYPVFLTVLILLMAFVTQSYAGISDAALLYLRIAPGSRAAGMGEAYVAIANDATATHWNPAGLGATPLANNWMVENIPPDMQPISEMAAVKARGGSGHNAYDLWTISPKGLSRYDNHHWFSYEVFSTRTDQTVSGIVKNYFNIEDEAALESAVAKVVAENSSLNIEVLEKFKTDVLATVPEDYSDAAAIQSGFDSLMNAYVLCKVNWEKFNEARSIYREGIKDSVLSEKELDRLNFALEKSRSRFIPEDLKVPYTSLVTGQITDIKAVGKLLFVGTTNGMFSYNGSSWKSYTSVDGLPSMNITVLGVVFNHVLIGTDSGLVKYDGTGIVNVGVPGELPAGTVTAIGGYNSTDIYIVMDQELYHYNGQSWSNYFTYTTTIDDTFSTIAQKLSIYGSASEREAVIARIKELNTGMDMTIPMENMPIDTALVNDSDTVVPVEMTESEVTTDSGDGEELVIVPGMELKVPYSSLLKGKVNKIHVQSQSQLYLGTEYGLLLFSHRAGTGEWKMLGYKDITVEEGQTLEDIAAANHDLVTSVETNLETIKVINGLTSNDIQVGQVLKVYSNPTAYPVNDINVSKQAVLVGTRYGMYELLNKSLSRISSSGLSNANIIKVDARGNEFWYASEDKIIIQASGRSEIAIMFAKWLPELADDIYYGFMSGVTNIDGLGTLGLSFTYINYGTIIRTEEGSPNQIGTFEPFDIAIAGSYGTSLTNNIKGGLSLKFIYSHLSRLGAGDEQGEGTATGLAIDFGFLWYINQRFNLGLAVTNLGPDISYIDAGQSDPLPRNLALGFAWKPKSTEYYHFLITAETNYSLVGMDGSFKDELKELIFNGGAEFQYNDIFAIRGGYIFDEEGDVKSLTIGCGLAPINSLNLDFAYIPSGTDAPLANTLRISTKYSW